jgi:carboxyl-terminal processing protease
VRALVLDLRESAGPRNAAEMHAVLGRLAHEEGLWRVRTARSGGRFEDRVRPMAHAARLPLVVLVDRWTQGEAESLAVGLRAVSSASLIGTPMAMLRGIAGSVRLPHSGLVARFAMERAHAPDGTLREDARPDVPVDLAAPSGGPGDPILYQALKRLERPRR